MRRVRFLGSLLWIVAGCGDEPGTTSNAIAAPLQRLLSYFSIDSGRFHSANFRRTYARRSLAVG